ncbi:hypothetical protein CL622_03225 [archaeon]|nr:hypothetical protein [archaeon]
MGSNFFMPYTLKDLSGYILKEEIPVKVDRNDQDEYFATEEITDLNIVGVGATEEKAVNHLQELVADAFADFMSEPRGMYIGPAMVMYDRLQNLVE